MYSILKVIFFTIFLIISVTAKKLEKVSDDEFLKLVQTEKHVVALFSTYTNFYYVLQLTETVK